MKRFTLVLACLFFSLSSALAAVPAAEKSALVALYNSTNGPSWDNRTNWLNGDPCDNEWYGIYCETRTNVNRIDLYGNNLVGTIPTELGNLGKLEILWLHRNQLSGSIPAALGDLATVNTIWLWENDLVGTIPGELGNLGKLEKLDLSSNELSGSIPATLGDLVNLVSLDLSRNDLSGSIPAALGQLANLDWLDLEHNKLTGMLPTTLGNLSMLRYLRLNDNELSGVIPSSFGSLGKLYLLDIKDNMLTGSIPTTFGNLANLIYLYLYENSLSGQIPASISKLAKLVTLDLDSNQLSGPIPSDLGKMTALRSLDLHKNQLTGAIPVSLGNLSMLSGLSLGSNQLTGEIPAVLGNMTSLSGLSLGHNQLSGAIPASLGTLTDLRGLSLNDNQLSGVIPTTLGNLKKLSGLYLENNQLSGPIPPSLGNLDQVTGLFLFNNQLSGPIPAELGNISAMFTLKLHDNMLSGPIPASLGDLPDIKVLSLHGNKLSGPVPAGFMSLTNLYYLDLNWNALYTNNKDLDDHLDTESGSDWSATQTIPPKSLRVTGVGSNSVSLAWKPIEYIADGGGYRVRYSTISGGPYMNGGFTANKASNSHTVSGLTPGQKYYFVVRSQTDSHSDNANIVNSSKSVQISGTTNGSSGSLAQPTGVMATDGTFSDRVRVSFNTVAGATVYRVYRCLTTGQTCGSAIGYPGTTTFDDTKGVPGTVYYYRIRACNATTCSSLSAANSGFSSTAPAKPTNVRATDGTHSDKVRVTFNTVTGATVYRVFRCLTTGPTCGSPIGFPKMGVFDDTKGDPGTIYYYRVRACTPGTCGLFSAANTGHRKLLPAKPTNVRASDGAYPQRVRVTWNKVTDATVYRVFRCQTTGQTCGSPVAFQKVPVFDDFKGKSGVVYYYRVRACTSTTCGLFSAANSGYRGNLPSAEADEMITDMNDVPIPALNDVGRWILIFMTMGLGWLLMHRRYGVK